MQYIFLASKYNLKNYIIETIKYRIFIQAYNSINITNYDYFMQLQNKYMHLINKFIIFNNELHIDKIKYIFTPIYNARTGIIT